MIAQCICSVCNMYVCISHDHTMQYIHAFMYIYASVMIVQCICGVCICIYACFWHDRIMQCIICVCCICGVCIDSCFRHDRPMQCIHVCVCVFMHQSWSPNARVACVYVCIHASDMIAKCNVFTWVCVCLCISHDRLMHMWCMYMYWFMLQAWSPNAMYSRVCVCVYASVMIA